MKYIITAIIPFLFLTSKLFSQNGYVILENDSLIEGYIKTEISFMDGQKDVELWRTPRDKDPLKFNLDEIKEYKKNKGIWRIFKNYHPFKDNMSIYFELVEAEFLIQGNVELLFINNQQSNVSSYTGGGLIPAIIDQSTGKQPIIYILNNKDDNYLVALPMSPKLLRPALVDFFDESIVIKFESVYGKLKLNKVKKYVRYFNENY